MERVGRTIVAAVTQKPYGIRHKIYWEDGGESESEIDPLGGEVWRVKWNNGSWVSAEDDHVRNCEILVKKECVT
jgi:hypothetical protein